MSFKHAHLFITSMFIVGAMITGFGHDAEMIGLGIVVVVALFLLMFSTPSKSK